MGQETPGGRWVFVLGRSAVLDVEDVATRAAAQHAELVLLSLGYPVSPKQDAVVQAALREAADHQVWFDAVLVPSPKRFGEYVHAGDEVTIVASGSERRKLDRALGIPPHNGERPDSPLGRPGTRPTGSDESARAQPALHRPHSQGGSSRARRTVRSRSTVFPRRRLAPARCRRRRGLRIGRGARGARGSPAHPRHGLVARGSRGAEAGSARGLPRRRARSGQDLRDAATRGSEPGRGAPTSSSGSCRPTGALGRSRPSRDSRWSRPGRRPTAGRPSRRWTSRR